METQSLKVSLARQTLNDLRQRARLKRLEAINQWGQQRETYLSLAMLFENAAQVIEDLLEGIQGM